MSVPATDGSPYLAAPEGRTPVGGIRQFLREVTSGAVVGLLALPFACPPEWWRMSLWGRTTSRSGQLRES